MRVTFLPLRPATLPALREDLRAALEAADWARAQQISRTIREVLRDDRDSRRTAA